MTKEEKSLLLKDLCARLPYMVIMNVDVLNIDCLLCAVYQNKEHPDCVGIGDNGIASIERVKPYLRPMSSMTEKEIKELSKIDQKRIIFSARHLTWHLDGEVIDYLNEKMFDWRELIPKGLALEAPEGMYEY